MNITCVRARERFAVKSYKNLGVSIAAADLAAELWKNLRLEVFIKNKTRDFSHN